MTTTAKTLKINPKINPGATISQTFTMAYRAVLKIKHNPEQLVDVVLQPILFTLMFTFIFGGAIAGSVADYLPILIPGIIVQCVLTACSATGVTMREDMEKGVFNRFRSLPIARIAPLAGALIADFIRYGIAISITFVMGLLLGYHPEAGLLMIFPAGLLALFSAWCVSWIFAYLGLKMKTAQSVSGLSMMILMPLTFMSNAFVPVDTMVPFMQFITKINPISHLVSAVRGILDTGSFGGDFWLTIAGMTAIVLVFAPLTVRAYRKRA